MNIKKIRRGSFKTSNSDKIFYSIVNITLILLLLVVAIPILNIFASSFSSGRAVASGRVFIWPVEWSLEGYAAVFRNNYIWSGYANTIYYTIVGTTINVILTLLAAYPLSRSDMPGVNIFMLIFAFTMIFAGGMIPSYLLIKNLGMLNTRWAIILPGAISVYNMIITRTYFISSIPKDLLEAAHIDGCSDFRYFIKIALPLSKSIIAVIALFYAVGHWNAYFNAFLYLSDKDLYPLQIILRDILLVNTMDSSMMIDAEMQASRANLADLLKYSLIIVASLPIWCVYPFVQKYFVQGVMIGSLKG